MLIEGHINYSEIEEMRVKFLYQLLGCLLESPLAIGCARDKRHNAEVGRGLEQEEEAIRVYEEVEITRRDNG